MKPARTRKVASKHGGRHRHVMRAALPCLLLLAVSGSNLPAAAGSSDWFETEGARIRLVTIDEPTPEGTLKGTLEIALDAGWKTYWADPGDAGIPPQIDIAGSQNVTSLMRAPSVSNQSLEPAAAGRTEPGIARSRR